MFVWKSTRISKNELQRKIRLMRELIDSMKDNIIIIEQNIIKMGIGNLWPKTVFNLAMSDKSYVSLNVFLTSKKIENDLCNIP